MKEFGTKFALIVRQYIDAIARCLSLDDLPEPTQQLFQRISTLVFPKKFVQVQIYDCKLDEPEQDVAAKLFQLKTTISAEVAQNRSEIEELNKSIETLQKICDGYSDSELERLI